MWSLNCLFIDRILYSHVSYMVCATLISRTRNASCRYPEFVTYMSQFHTRQQRIQCAGIVIIVVYSACLLVCASVCKRH